MAAKKSKENPYLWSNGTWHSRPQGKQYREPAKKTKTVTLTKAPAGSYDPALDAQERAAKRGFEDLLEDAERTGKRETTDWTLGRGDLARQKVELDEDIGVAREGVERSYKQTIDDMLRNYGQLGRQQGERQRAAGLLYGGGAAEQATQKRAANQAIEKSRTDEARQVSLDDLLRQQQRGVATADRAGGELNLGYQRAQEDRNLFQIPRARREFEAFKQDLGESRMAQYLQGGGKLTQTVKVKPKPLPETEGVEPQDEGEDLMARKRAARPRSDHREGQRRRPLRPAALDAQPPARRGRDAVQAGEAGGQGRGALLDPHGAQGAQAAGAPSTTRRSARPTSHAPTSSRRSARSEPQPIRSAPRRRASRA